jgi:hypothetical protein
VETCPVVGEGNTRGMEKRERDKRELTNNHMTDRTTVCLLEASNGKKFEHLGECYQGREEWGIYLHGVPYQ